MRTLKYKVCALKLARVKNGELTSAWEDEVLKHLSDKQAGSYARRKYGENIVILNKENTVKEIDANKAYEAVKENNHE